LDQQVAAEREQYQPTASEKIFAIVKSMLLRGMVIYFIMQMFRRPQPQPGTGSETGAKFGKGGAATNLFENGTVFDLYVYLSEFEDNAKLNYHDIDLIWKQEGLIYGDWYSGPNGDGTYSLSMQFEPSKALQNNGSIFMLML